MLVKNFRSIVIVPLVTLAGASAVRISAEPANVFLTIEYVDCPKNLGANGDIRVVIFDEKGATVLSRHYATAATAGVQDIEISLRPGGYTGVVAKGDCGDELLITLLQARPRHILAIGWNSAPLRTNRGMLSGTIPFSGAQVAVIYRDRRALDGRSSSPDGYLQLSALVEGTAYYATGLPDGEATVRIYNEGHNKWLDFDAGRIDQSAGRLTLVRDISLNEITQKLEWLAHQKTMCAPGKARLTVCTPPK